MKTLTLPDLGEGLREAEIVAWHVSNGDHVNRDQPLVSVETAKAVVEIPAPWSGRVVRTFGEPREIVAVGRPLVEIETGIEDGADYGTVVGELAVGPDSGPGSEPPSAIERIQDIAPDQVQSRRAAKASPAVRRQAADLGIDLAEVTGTGPSGTITMADLRATNHPVLAGDRYEALRGVRRAMAEAMTRSRGEIVAATLTDEAIIETWSNDADPTVRLIRAIAAGCCAAPALNAWFDSASNARRLHSRIDLGVAIETADGLFVPVLRDVGDRDPADLRVALGVAKRNVASRTIPAADLQGQTLTLSNFGMLGGMHAVLTIMPPQVAILGAGRIHHAARVIDGDVKAVRVLPLSLSFDHRVVTGAEACRFMSAVIAELVR
jgi:pyruvate dehydrogenase E2 component (dihydrolipoamide acetyltransferase)